MLFYYLFIFILLTGCAQEQPAPFVQKSIGTLIQTLEPKGKVKEVKGCINVKPGDSLNSLARERRMDPLLLAKINELDPPYSLQVGQKICFEARTAKTPPPTKRFLKPVKGDIISPFGSHGKGLYNDGINIAASVGTEVSAADQGQVIYVGSSVGTFGNLVLVKHAGGWISAYGHLDQIKVQKGEAVQKGQTLGTVGTTGRQITVPQVHFELRHGAKPVDPMNYTQ